MKKFEEFNKQKKDALFLKNHTLVWFKEWSKIYNQLKNTEVELEEALKFKQNSIDYMDMFDGIDSGRLLTVYRCWGVSPRRSRWRRLAMSHPHTP